MKVDVSQFVTSTIDGYLDALRAGDTEPELLQVRATALLDGRALAGSARIEGWRARLAPYPGSSDSRCSTARCRRDPSSGWRCWSRATTRCC